MASVASIAAAAGAAAGALPRLFLVDLRSDDRYKEDRDNRCNDHSSHKDPSLFRRGDLMDAQRVFVVLILANQQVEKRSQGDDRDSGPNGEAVAGDEHTELIDD